MPVPLLLLAGTALQMIGQSQANMAQAQAELINEQMYKDQAQFALDSQFRQEMIAQANYAALKGAQASAYAKGGVSVSGSAAATLAATTAKGIAEIDAIRKKGKLEFTLAALRAKQSGRTAATLQSAEYNLMQGGSTVLGNAATSNGFGLGGSSK